MALCRIASMELVVLFCMAIGHVANASDVDDDVDVGDD